MSDEEPDTNAEKFRVYVTADIDLSIVPQLLACEWSDDGDGYDIQKATGTAQDICKLHRRTAPPGGIAYTSLFLILDDPDPKTAGVLVVNLTPEHGYPDAVRHELEGVGNVPASLSISNHDWYDDRQSTVEHKTACVPEKYFALYDLVNDDSFDRALKLMNDGLQNVDIEEGELTPEPEGVAKQYHVKCSGKMVDQIKKDHGWVAAEHELETNRFAVVDDKFEEEGALFVQLKPVEDSFRCKNYVGGEILGWIFIRFMMWKEAKELAATV